MFADVDPASWCISAEALEAALTPRTKGVVVVDLYGNMPDMKALAAVAAEHGIALIEDAAQAIGSTFAGKPAGSFGVVSVFSFHGSKTLTTGEGGMFVTDDDNLWQRCLALRDHGRQPGDTMFYNLEIGYKYKMSSMQAALGLAQLERIDELITRKREIFSWYRTQLSDIGGLALNHEAPCVRNTYWMVTAVLEPFLGLRKDELMTTLARQGIATRPFFHPLSSLPAYAAVPSAAAAMTRNKVAYAIAPYGINLPSALSLTQDAVLEVCRSFRAALNFGR